MTAVNNEVKAIVVVEFDSGYKHYDFKNDIAGLVVGDKVVVDASPGISVATVVGFKDVSKAATKYIIQKVDLDTHKARLEKDKKLAEIKAKMEKRRKELQEIEIYQILAKEDSDMAKLLEEFTALN